MANVTWKNLNTSKLNKTFKHLHKTGVLVGPRASKGSYGDLANILQAKIDTRESIQKSEERRPRRLQGRPRKTPKTGTPKKQGPKGTQPFGGRRGIGIAVKGGGRIL